MLSTGAGNKVMNLTFKEQHERLTSEHAAITEQLRSATDQTDQVQPRSTEFYQAHATVEQLRRRLDGIESARCQLELEYPEAAAMDHICHGLALLEQEQDISVLAAAASVLSGAMADLNARLYTDLTGERVRRPRRRRFQQKGATR